MQKLLPFCLLLVASLPLSAGCWGESNGSMSRRLQQQRELMEANDSKSGVVDPDSGLPSAPKTAGTKTGIAPPDADSGITPPPKEIVAAGATTAGKSSPMPPIKPGAAFTPNINPASVAPLSPTATVEQRRARTMENLAKLGKALNAYSDRIGDFPGMAAGYPATKTIDSPAYPPISWRVAILPQLGYENLFKQYKPDEPWDSAVNKQVLAHIPPEYQSPERRDYKTNYLVPLANFAAFGGGNRLHRSSFEDPQDQTLILVEADDSQAVEWTRPDDLPVQVAPGTSLKSKLGTLRGDGFFAVLANGRVCRIKPDADERALQALFTINGEDTQHIKGAIQEATAVPVSLPVETGAASVASADTSSSARKGAPAPAESVAEKGVPSAPSDEPVATASPLKPRAPLAKKKLPVPSESELVSARATLRKLYAEDQKKAKKSSERRQLAMKLAANSREAGEDHAAVYELLRMSRDLSAQNGDLTEALKAVSQLEQRFEIDAPAMRLETLNLFQKSPDAEGKHAELGKEAKSLMAEAIQADQYDIALEALKISKGTAKRGDDSKYLAKAGKKQIWLEAAKRAFNDASKAELRLAADPSDPQANQIVGLYTCFVKGRWELGLPQLAKATDLKLRFLAKLDLSSSKSPQEIFDLANQYWDLAVQKPDLEEQGLKLRAAYWYAQAIKELPDGLDKIKARKRLTEIIDAYGKEVTEKATGRKDITALAAVRDTE